jgi:hypothetical protein
MKISELIQKLHEFLDAQGDIDIYLSVGGMGCSEIEVVAEKQGDRTVLTLGG